MKQIDIGRAALVLIEFQHEWVAPTGKLQRGLIHDKDAFRSAVAAAGDLLAHARERRWAIAHAGLSFTRDPGYLLFGRGEGRLGLRGAIPHAGTWGEEGSRFVEPFVPREGEFVVQGRSGASVLKSSTLDPFLRNNDLRTLLLCGFATHVCVESTLREAHDLGYDAYVVSDACAAFERSQHEHVLQHVVHHFGGQVTSAELRAL
ncbi:cysteine hydrolase [Anaeromyxobacter dehalogenans]|uniref:Isochorismatase hydrolase n=1 Tax=Anaeromyxobacter dehalogenans (strain 2CP-C) TaxID=290397 RepID=Q2IPS1_ANADE|nr:cysteine hydrolase [Anaeromyxobacter dehalogenans]ABC80805.1 Isochorismatase hydrolase [Anaeromyxobacter dehalogenans 2CP-C]